MAAKLVSVGNKAIALAKPKVSNFLYYARHELTPPSPKEIPEVIRGFGRLLSGYKNGTWKNITVKEAMVNTAVTIEVICWFYIGEVIGKRHFIGYKVG